MKALTLLRSWRAWLVAAAVAIGLAACASARVTRARSEWRQAAVARGVVNEGNGALLWQGFVRQRVSAGTFAFAVLGSANAQSSGGPSAWLTEVAWRVGATSTVHYAAQPRNIEDALKGLREKILPARPDVVFIDLCAGDYGSPPGRERRVLEQMVRLALSQEQHPAVVLVLSTTSQGHGMVAEHQAVGEYYHLPMFSLWRALDPEFRRGRLRREAIYRAAAGSDSPLLTEEGHRWTADIIAHSLQRIRHLQVPPPDTPLPPPMKE